MAAWSFTWLQFDAKQSRRAREPAPWIGIHGSRALRLELAVETIDQLIRRGWDLAEPLG